MGKQKFIHITDIISAYKCAGLSVTDLPPAPDGAPGQTGRDYSQPMKNVVLFVSQTSQEDAQHLNWKIAQDSLEEQFEFLKNIPDPVIDYGMPISKCQADLRKWQEQIIEQFGPWHQVKTIEDCPGIKKRDAAIVVIGGIACHHPTQKMGQHNFILN